MTDYTTSIVALQYSLWMHHSFSLGHLGSPIVQSVDVGTYNGNYYSEISPGFAIISFPVSAVGFILDGNTLKLLGHILYADEGFLAFCSSLAAIFVYRICRFYSDQIPSLLASLAFALATTLWPVTTMIYIEGASVMFSTASVYFLFRHMKVTKSERDLILSGICLGLAAFVEYMAALFLVPIVVYLLVRRSGIWRTMRFVDSFAIFGPLLWLTTNYLAFRSPFVFPEQLKNGPIFNQFDLGSMFIHVGAYIGSPYRGIFVFSPVLVLGVFMIAKMIRQRELRLDALLFSSFFLLILFAYSAWSDWAGGLVYGPRFLLLGIPYLAIPISILLKRSWRYAVAFFFLFDVSVFQQWIGAFTTALSVSGGIFTYQLYSLNLPWFIQGNFDTWWLQGLRKAPPIELQLIVGLFLFAIVAYCFVLVREIPQPPTSRVLTQISRQNS
jgi:hypothetical protein